MKVNKIEVSIRGVEEENTSFEFVNFTIEHNKHNIKIAKGNWSETELDTILNVFRTLKRITKEKLIGKAKADKK